MKLKINHKTLVGTGTYKKCGTGIGIEYVPMFHIFLIRIW